MKAGENLKVVYAECPTKSGSFAAFKEMDGANAHPHLK
jgi:hypothetical protein